MKNTNSYLELFGKRFNLSNLIVKCTLVLSVTALIIKILLNIIYGDKLIDTPFVISVILIPWSLYHLSKN